ncbi:MAG: hypothetical protein Kow0090_07080 [Myxococcota bacterium]
MKRFFLSLEFKFIALAAIIFIVILVSAFSIELHFVKNEFIKSLKSNSEIVCKTFYQHLIHSMPMNDKERFILTIRAMINPDVVSEFSLFDRKWNITASTLDKPPQSKFPNELVSRNNYAPTWQLTDEDKKAAILYFPIPNEHKCLKCHNSADRYLGGIKMTVSFEAEIEKLESLAFTHQAEVSATILALIITLWLLTRGMIIRPLILLTEAQERVSNGDLSTRVPSTRLDEIGKLSQGFNTMVGKLGKARTELEHQYRENLLKADRIASFGELASGLAHEIKNPLAAIYGGLETLRDDANDVKDDANREIFDEMIVQLRRIEKTVSDLLLFAKPPEPIFEKIDLNEAVRSVFYLIQQSREARSIQCELTLSKEPIWVFADIEKLRQVFMNLMLNAI